MLQSVDLYQHAKNQKIHSSVSEKISKKTIFDTQFPANQWITFLENGHLGQMLYSVGLYHNADVVQCWPLSSCKNQINL